MKLVPVLLFALATPLVAIAQDGPPQAAPSEDAALQDGALESGRERSEGFASGNLGAIWEAMTPQMQETLGSLDAFEAFQQGVVEELGDEVEIVDETTETQGTLAVYTRTARWSQSESPVAMQWSFDPDGAIAGFFVQPQPDAAPSDHLDYQTQADLRLPFEGEWYVFWGGRDIADNYHAADPAQRFAYDFVVHEDGASYSGDPEILTSYHCWDREILAPADGMVVATVHDLPDQEIGSTDPDNPAGNHVILALGSDEYAFLAHFQQSSIRVQAGDDVSAGDVLGLCGNSGNTSEPHLHIHLQTTPDLLNGEGLPAQFIDYAADGEPVDRGEPLRGESVAPAGD